MRLIDLKEGGKALSTSGVVRIKRKDIPATIKYVSKISGIPTKDLHPLGSVGKMPSSGDLDFAVDVKKHDSGSVHAKMEKAVGAENAVFNNGTKVGSYAVPIQGQEDQKVQTDLMYVDNVKWAQFAYFSSGENSKYKGVVRTILISSAAGALDEKGQDLFKYNEDGELMVRIGRGIDMNKGLKRILQMRPKKKKGDGYLKTMKTVTLDDIKDLHPDIEIEDNNIIIDDPEEVVKVIFGPSVKPSDVDTAEEVIELIKTMDEKKQAKVYEIAKNRLRAFKDIKVPEELQ